MQTGRKINLSVTDFKQFRQGGYLYVDKTAFIEHFLEEGSTVFLFCRPRRMGKSMNLTMLKYFFDLKEDSADLFKGLLIEQSPLYRERNKYPVIHLNFREMHFDDYVAAFADIIRKELERYLEPDQLTKNVEMALSEPYPLVKNLLKNACENLYNVYGVAPFIFIDEYDKLIMDNIDRPEFEDIRNFVKSVMSNALKDNPYLSRAAVTGVNRITQESMFSDLNNIVICDVFEESAFDTDFGFTEDEIETVLKQVDRQERMKDLRTWYNNYRVGDKTVYFSYSVLSAIAKDKLGNFWGRSGVMESIRSHLTPERVELITELLNGFPEARQEVSLKDRLSVEDMKAYQEDGAFYSLLVQTGYLTYAPATVGSVSLMAMQSIFLPNQELKYVWQEFIFRDIYRGKPQEFWRVLHDIKNVRSLGIGLTDAMNNRLS